MDKIVINVTGQTDLDSTLKKLTELGLIDEKNAKSFQANNKQSQAAIDQTKGKLGGFEKALTNIGPALAGAFAFSSIVSLGSKILDITSKFQKFEAVLTNALGSKSAAQESMQMIMEFAAKTPFAVDEITESYIKLVNQGFKPTQAEMTKLGDLASSQGKSLNQLTEAVIDAQTGEFERLKEFGIRAKKEGDKVTFTFKEQNTTVKATAGSIREYILGLGNAQGVSGSMAAISKTLEGQLSNLGDTFDQVLLSIGKSGSGGFAQVIGGLNGALGELNNALQDKPSMLDSVKEAFIGLFRPVKDLYDSIVGLVSNFVDFEKTGSAAGGVMTYIGTSLKFALVPMKATIVGFITLIDTLNTLVKAGKNVYNFFKGNELEDIGLGKLKKDFSNFVDVITLADGKFNYATGNIVSNTDKVVKATEKEVKSIKTLEDELKELIKLRDETDVSDRKTINNLNTKIKATQEYIKELKGEGEAAKKAKKDLEAWEKMQAKPVAGDINLELKGQESLSKEKIKLKKLEEKEFDDSEKRQTEKLLKEQENRKQANQIYTDFAINSILQIAEAFQENNRIKTQNELHRLDTETDAQLAALEKRNKQGLISEETYVSQKNVILDKQRKRDLAIRRRQAQQEKDFALFQIAINTAAAIIKTIGQLGAPIPPNFLAIAGVAAAAGAGALEAAIVSSRPLPEYKKGGYTGDGNVNSEAGIVHKKEFVMPAEKTAKYRTELQEMYEGRYRKPVKLDRSLTDVRQENMAENISQSIMMNGQFDDKNIVNAIARNGKIKLANSGELASQIANKIADRNSERGLFA